MTHVSKARQDARLAAIEKALRQRDPEMKGADYALRFDCNRKTIHRVAKKLGLKFKPGGGVEEVKHG